MEDMIQVKELTDATQPGTIGCEVQTASNGIPTNETQWTVLEVGCDKSHSTAVAAKKVWLQRRYFLETRMSK